MFKVGAMIFFILLKAKIWAQQAATLQKFIKIVLSKSLGHQIALDHKVDQLLCQRKFAIAL